ncbi:MAG: hypothetical protein AB7D96_07665 [Arcobacteraceae bacterium]
MEKIEDKISKIFGICAENHNESIKVWMFASKTNEQKRMTEAELQITYLPLDCYDENEPYDTKVTIKMDDQNSIDFAIDQLFKAIKIFELDKLMTFFDSQNNIKNLKHISQKGVKNGN